MAAKLEWELLVGFEEDIEFLISRLVECGAHTAKGELDGVRDKLFELRRRNLVKINHSVIELLCASYLIRNGYEVDVERRLTDILTCDVYGVKGDGNVIVEVETGFTPPEHALDPGTYNKVRIVSKVARYSKFSNKFILGTPPTNILQIPRLFCKPPRFRMAEELSEMKALCDRYYTNPPIELEEIKFGRLYAVYILDVDKLKVTEVDIDAYVEALSAFPHLAENAR
ncbi:MAG: hypothetical protein QXJ75_05255 [Candidatus Bathyarchaeia archaeon]